MRVLPAGDGAILLEFAGDDQNSVDQNGVDQSAADLVSAGLAGLKALLPDGVIELVPAARTILVEFDRSRISPEKIAAAVDAVHDELTRSMDSADEVVIPVVYDGPDLEDVADATGLSIAEVIERHSGAPYRVAFCGFAPGFAYLNGLDPALELPRRATPRTRVPTGSVAIADEYTGVYPSASPGGWHLLGRTDAVLWDVERDPPALLAPGTRVRFRPVPSAGARP